MTNYDKIEAYFDNELSEADKEALFREMEVNPDLKQEFELQQEIIDGIKAYRKEQLIARLNRVEIAATGQASWLKALGIIGVAGLVSVGGYLWYNHSGTAPIEQPAILTEQPEPAPVTGNSLPARPAPDQEDAAPAARPEEPASSPVRQEQPAADMTAPEITIPEVTEPEVSSPVNVEEDLTAPEPVKAASVQPKSGVTVEVKFSKKYKFHYQIKNGGLILYGTFDKGPFEVLEIKTSKGIASYLYYNNNFYGLITGTEEIKPLVAVTNPELISELQKRR